MRDYLIDVVSGDSKPITPEGIAGTTVSVDGRRTAVRGPDGKWGVWPVEGGGFQPIPELDGKWVITGWSPDGNSLYAIASHTQERARRLYRVDVATGKIEPWKTFGTELGAGAIAAPPDFSSDGSAYAYLYFQDLTVAYVVRGLQ